VWFAIFGSNVNIDEKGAGASEFSTEKCERLLGYKPVFSFEQAMQELAAEFGHSSQPSTKSPTS